MPSHKPAVSSLTTKFQATIPSEVRIKLGLKAGDKVQFLVTESGEVVLKKLARTDVPYLSAVEQTLDEWNSSADEEAFRGL
jgi:antitoxin PrlF